MRRIVWSVALVGIALLLGGCGASRNAQDEPAKPVQVKSVTPGSEVTLKNGLTLTVPEGWTANLATHPAPGAPLFDSEYLQLENMQVTDGFKTVLVFSSTVDTLPVSALDKYGHDTFTPAGRVGDTDLYVGKPGTPYEPKRLMAAVTRLPGSQLGVFYFAGTPEDPAAVVRAVWELLQIQGAH